MAKVFEEKNSQLYYDYFVEMIKGKHDPDIEKCNNLVATLKRIDKHLNIQYEEKLTLLHHACNEGHTKIAKLLIDNGADVNAKGGDNWTPLHVACDKGYTEIANLLIENDADLNGATHDKGSTPLIMAIHSQSSNIANLLIEKGANVNKVSFFGFHPLYLACCAQLENVAKNILENKEMDLNYKDPCGFTTIKSSFEELKDKSKASELEKIYNTKVLLTNITKNQDTFFQPEKPGNNNNNEEEDKYSCS